MRDFKLNCFAFDSGKPTFMINGQVVMKQTFKILEPFNLLLTDITVRYVLFCFSTVRKNILRWISVEMFALNYRKFKKSLL